MKSQKMFMWLSSPTIHGILRSQIVAEMTLSVMRSRGPRMSQKMLKTKRGLRWPKSHLLSKKEKKKKPKFLNPLEMEEELKAHHQPVSKWHRIS